MASGGYNGHTLLREFVSKIEFAERKRGASFGVTDYDALRYIFEALVSIHKKEKRVEDRFLQDTVFNQPNYLLPKNRVGYLINGVGCVKTDGNDPVWLERRSEDWIETHADHFDDPTLAGGDPRYWAFSFKYAGQLLVWPPPKTSVDDGLVMRFPVMPAYPWRIINQGSITAAVVQDSDTVQLSGTGLDIRVGDEIGICPTGNTDGTSNRNTLIQNPLIWYLVKTVDAAHDTLTLWDAYDQGSNPTARFITAQVPPMELLVPGYLEYRPVYLALHNYFSNFPQEGTEAAYWLAKSEKQEAESVIEEDDEYARDREWVAPFASSLGGMR